MIINLKESWLFFVCRCILYRDLFAIGIFSIDANKLIFVSSKQFHLLLVNTVCSVNFYPLGTVPIQWIHSDNALISQHMGTKNSNISKCNSIASLKFLNVCTVFVNTETGMVCLCSAQCSLNVFNSACLM